LVFNDDSGERERKLDQQVVETLRNLKANSFNAKFAESGDMAKEMILNSISKDAVVGVGDSATVRQIGILEEIERRGIRVLNPYSRELTADPSETVVRDDISRQIFSCDALVTGARAR
jgi:hypothetical protein